MRGRALPRAPRLPLRRRRPGPGRPSPRPRAAGPASRTGLPEPRQPRPRRAAPPEPRLPFAWRPVPGQRDRGCWLGLLGSATSQRLSLSTGLPGFMSRGQHGARARLFPLGWCGGVARLNFCSTEWLGENNPASCVNSQGRTSVRGDRAPAGRANAIRIVAECPDFPRRGSHRQSRPAPVGRRSVPTQPGQGAGLAVAFGDSISRTSLGKSCTLLAKNKPRTTPEPGHAPPVNAGDPQGRG